MRNPFKRKPKYVEPTEAQRAHLDAVVSLARTTAREDEVHNVVRSLREWRERNHVVAQLDQIFYGGMKP